MSTKVCIVTAMIFPVLTHRCEIWTIGTEKGRRSAKEDRVLRNWCFLAVMLEKTLESPLNSTEIKLVNPKGNQPWIFIRRTDAEAEAPILWPPDAKSWLIGKDSDAGKDWGQMEKGMTEDEMVGWHHWLNGHEFEWTPGDGQGGLECCDSWGRKESDTTGRLNWTEVSFLFAGYIHLLCLQMDLMQWSSILQVTEMR